MSYKTPIEWTDATWNPVRGCSKISSGCENCYAQRFAERFRGVPGHPFEQGFDLRLVQHKLDEPIHWKSPRKVFVCSMSDLFHEDVPLDYLCRVFEVMQCASWHTFQILTKRPSRLLQIVPEVPWSPNIWVGATIESAVYSDRARQLAAIPATVKFLSLEPLLGPIRDLPLEGINWVIVGGESGSRARPMDLEWARNIRDQCMEANVAFFLKQLGGRNGKRGADQAMLDGRRWREFPKSEVVTAVH